MSTFYDIERPSKAEQKTAMVSHSTLESTLKHIRSENPVIEIEETGKRFKIPRRALELLVKILEQTSKGIPVSIVPIATEITTQAAAEMLGCSRPHLVKLLEKGEISYTKVGKHRRIKYSDVVEYNKQRKAEQRKRLIEMMKKDEETGLYDL